MKIACAAVFCGLLSTSCMHVTYAAGPGSVRGSVKQSGTNHFFLWGLINTSEVDLQGTCPDGLSRATVYKGFVDGLLELITIGIYSPRSWEAWCKS